MSGKVILIRYGEIFLKSDPVRRRYVRQLRDNIKDGFRHHKVKSDISTTKGRMFIRVPTTQTEKACSVLKKTFGIVSFSVCDQLDTSEIKEIQKFVKKNYRDWIPKGRKFAVRGKRSGSHSYSSIELAKRVGDVVSRKVDLTSPDVEIFVEVRDSDTYVYTEVMQGSGGMPIGTAGKTVCLMSGGIDSPVAAWNMMKRGCQIIALYADTYPYGSKKGLKRAKDVIGVLQTWSNGWEIPMYSFDHGSNLKAFIETKGVQSNLVCLMCKRMMYRIANELAKEHEALAIITGETLGEVASQTLYNLRVLDEASELPVFRPLIGNDKQENVDIAESIGTFEKTVSLSAVCKAVPFQPRTKGNLEEIREAESKLNMKKLVKDSMKSVKKRKM